jgi:hypothetical protein
MRWTFPDCRIAAGIQTGGWVSDVSCSVPGSNQQRYSQADQRGGPQLKDGIGHGGVQFSQERGGADGDQKSAYDQFRVHRYSDFLWHFRSSPAKVSF